MAIDGLQVKVTKPKEGGRAYYSRKLFYAANLLAGCDADAKITWYKWWRPMGVYAQV